jgi:hypothetical protein
VEQVRITESITAQMELLTPAAVAVAVLSLVLLFLEDLELLL